MSDDKMTFDEYCDAHKITDEEAPIAFGAYLNYLSGWDGEMHEVKS